MMCVYLYQQTNKNTEKMTNNNSNLWTVAELGRLFVVEASGVWTGKYYQTEKSAQRAANKANKLAGLIK